MSQTLRCFSASIHRGHALSCDPSLAFQPPPKELQMPTQSRRAVPLQPLTNILSEQTRRWLAALEAAPDADSRSNRVHDLGSANLAGGDMGSLRREDTRGGRRPARRPATAHRAVLGGGRF